MASNRIPALNVALFIGFAVMGCAIDLATKSMIFHKLGMPYESAPIVLVPGVFSLTTSLNAGALFGLGQGMTLAFEVLSLLAAVGIFYWLFFGGAGRDRWLSVALGALTAGILGNLYDRLGLPGLVWQRTDPRAGQAVHAVRDWLHFEIQKLHFDWPVFNLADSLLVLGACMLLWHVAWREQHLRAAETTSAESAPSSSG